MRLVEKLVQASGGWERFLYQTLKEVCEKVGTYGFTGDGEDSIDEAIEILEAYEEAGKKGQPDVIVPTPVIKTQAQVAVEVDEPHGTIEVDIPGRVGVPIDKPVITESVEPKPKPKPIPKKMVTRISVDKDAGASHGELPIPNGCNIVNKRNLTIKTRSGIELGRCGEDGQVKGSNVSGHVASVGRFRLVFKDVELGTAVLHYEVQEDE